MLLASPVHNTWDGVQFGQLNAQQKSDIAGYVRSAIAIQRLGRDAEAEKLIRFALENYPNNPDLIAQLGIIYFYCRPRRITDARKQFERAQKLGCKRERMYATWATMENNQEEWLSAIAVAEAGIKAGNETEELYYLAGYAHSRHAQYLKRSLHDDLAKQELLEADRLLRKALKDPEDLAYGEWKLHSRILRALVINCAELGKRKDMHYFIKRWQKEHPQDERAISEGNKLMSLYPLSAIEM
jgi:tetratricopeptide (TPR) repeat protein